jgi:group I intron endonuclease
MNANQRGIYAIRCIPTGCSYVGSTTSAFIQRWHNHRCQLRKGKHSNPQLQAAWDQHGAEAFELVILQTTQMQKDDPRLKPFLREREVHWVRKLKRSSGCYNLHLN